MGIIGDRNNHLINFHLHMPHLQFHHHHEPRDIPKGFLAVKVGQGAAEQQQRFIVPVMYVNHPLFTQLLKEAEEEYGFDQEGPINIPCQIEEFTQVRGIIDSETASSHNHHSQLNHHHHHFLCFKV